MCGFAGLLSPGSPEQLTTRLSSMISTLAHRGPDGQGTFIAEGIALAHQRLSVIDLSVTGAQPMSTPRGTTVVYNGEAYNFRDLRELLSREGVSFRGSSDTEVLLATYEAWGLDGLRRIEGMFAFSLWDAAKRRLVLMRDRLGIKPVFYAWTRDTLVFGSEIKALLAAGGVTRDLDDQALSEYLWYGNAFEERTIYRAVRAVPPGHWLLVEDGKSRLEAWWRVEEWVNRRSPPDCAAATIAVRDAVYSAVSRQLVSDVPVGVFLSGGIDSSSIAAVAARASPESIKSYSVGFDFAAGVNELPKARRVAAKLGLQHHELQVKGDDLEEVLVALVRAHDEPFADAANIPLYLLARALNGSVKVVLQGDGGDEMFGGYRRYALLRHADIWKLCSGWAARLVRVGLGAHGRRVARLAEAAGSLDAAMRMALLLTVETLHDPPTAMLAPDARERLERGTDPFAAFRRCAARFSDADPVQQMLLTDITLQLPSQFLTKVDRATMAHGVEARVPLLDERIAEVAVGLPSEYKVRGSEKKIVLRDAMRGSVPDEVLDGPKTGFGVPYEHWLRTSLYPMAREAVLAPDFITRFGLDAARIAGAFEEHRSGHRQRGFLLWKLFQLSLWAREAV